LKSIQKRDDMSKNEGNNNTGEILIILIGILTIAFIVLKLCLVIKWSWF